MFIGHFAAGFAGKAVSPKVSLATLFLAAQFLDLLWPTLLLLNLESVEITPTPGKFTPLNFTSYPISHSLLMVLGWGLLFGLGYWLLQKDKKTAVLLGLLVISHWLIDLIVHVPDLPLYPGNSPLVGLGLWNSTPATVLVEGAIFTGGLWLYLRHTQAKNKTGYYALWSLVLLLVLVYAASIFGPAPEQVSDIAWAGQLQWLFILWAWWADRNRTVKAPTQQQPQVSLQH
ncbi:hypothetical protein CLV24_12248 [Pontibacter ummariensis]|uniref:Uncharacterized protein n=1 Tax=Pontibacter ummariensis TaxID=1610492 RepID=A0A239JLN3_9BACT|nr:hypothetical protein [Pontibacter ummariensis]PRY07858.1 hypothetical protein CLV24_12248 [Pontibacter ummariensis]SNT06223.1 hypothetical protein SAMN06296052_12248 [Pontibacter ummariensis]